MKFRRKIPLLLMALLPFLLCGCMKFTLYLDVDRDQNIEYHGSVYVPETAISSEDDLDLLYDGLFKGSDLLKDRVSSETEIGDQKFKGCTFTGTGEQVKDFVSVEQVNSQMHLHLSSAQILDNVSDLPLNMNVFEDKGGTDLASLSEFGAEAVIEIQMPGKVLSSSHGEINGDTVRIDLLETLGQDVEIVSLIHKPEVDAQIAGITGATGLFCAAVLYNESKRKKEGK